MAIFQFYKMAAAAILDFENVEILGGDRSNRCWDIAIFRFFKMAAAAILDFENVEILGAEGSRRPKCITVPNFAEIGRTVA